jgi:cytochrome c oxidase cbb3-type subunit 1
MVMFGAMYYIIPRLTGREWASSALMRVHFWATALGVLMMFGVLSIGGVIQGLEMNMAHEAWWKLVSEQGLISGTVAFFKGMQMPSGAVPFMDIVRGTVPWLVLRSVSGMLITIGHLAFFILVAMNIHAWARCPSGGPTLFHPADHRYREMVGGAG